MGSALTTTITVTAELEGTFEEFLDELVSSLALHGIVFSAAGVVENGFQVGRVLEWEPGRRILLEWRSADWEPEARSELELRSEQGSHVVLEHRGFGAPLADQVPGWLADRVAGSFLRASAPAALGDWLTERWARRPSGARADETYRDPTHHRPSFGAVLEALALRPDDVLLEIGCGGGAFLEQALRSGCRALAVDHSPQMATLAREVNAEAVAAGRLEVVQASAERLPFADASCTCAAMMQVFFFLEPGPALAEVRRVLRPGGRMAVFTVSEQARGTPAAPEPIASRGRFYSDSELTALAHAAGFADAVVEHPELGRHAREAGLSSELVELFADGSVDSQLLVARG